MKGTTKVLGEILKLFKTVIIEDGRLFAFFDTDGMTYDDTRIYFEEPHDGCNYTITDIKRYSAKPGYDINEQGSGELEIILEYEDNSKVKLIPYMLVEYDFENYEEDADGISHVKPIHTIMLGRILEQFAYIAIGDGKFGGYYYYVTSYSQDSLGFGEDTAIYKIRNDDIEDFCIKGKDGESVYIGINFKDKTDMFIEAIIDDED